MIQINQRDDGDKLPPRTSETQNPASRACFSLTVCLTTCRGINILKNSTSTPHPKPRGVFQVLALLPSDTDIRQLVCARIFVLKGHVCEDGLHCRKGKNPIIHSVEKLPSNSFVSGPETYLGRDVRRSL
jgi:hypothetical protein